MTDMEKILAEIPYPGFGSEGFRYSGWRAGVRHTFLRLHELGYRKVPEEAELRNYLVMRFLEKIPPYGSYYDHEAQMLHQWLLERI